MNQNFSKKEKNVSSLKLYSFQDILWFLFIPRVAPSVSIMYIQTGVEKENVFVGLWESTSLPVGALEVGLPSFGYS